MSLADWEIELEHERDFMIAYNMRHEVQAIRNESRDALRQLKLDIQLRIECALHRLEYEL